MLILMLFTINFVRKIHFLIIQMFIMMLINVSLTASDIFIFQVQKTDKYTTQSYRKSASVNETFFLLSVFF